jgi:hypothetical protein
MTAVTSKRRAASRGRNNSKKKGQMSFNYGERDKKQEFPVWGGGAAKMATQAIPPPKDAEFPPKIGGVTSSPRGRIRVLDSDPVIR